MASLIGKEICRYHITEYLGPGGMAEVDIGVHSPRLEIHNKIYYLRFKGSLGVICMAVSINKETISYLWFIIITLCLSEPPNTLMNQKKTEFRGSH